jgi:cytochrome c-type biogenesis protein CcmH/NrfG
MADEHLVEKIEAWLSGRLSPEEAAAFQAQVRADPALAEEVELHRLTLGAMRQLAENDLREKVSNWLDDVTVEYPVEKKAASSPAGRLKQLLLAFTLLALLLAGAFVLFKWGENQAKAAKEAEVNTLKMELETLRQEMMERRREPVSPAAHSDSIQQVLLRLREKINELESKKNGRGTEPVAAVEGYYVKPYLSKMRRELDRPDSLFNEAVSAFDANEFDRTAALCTAVLSEKPGDQKTRRLLAYAHFRMKFYVDALEDFQPMIKIESWKEEAEWHILLCRKALSTVDARQRELFWAELKRIAGNKRHRFHQNALILQEKDK